MGKVLCKMFGEYVCFYDLKYNDKTDVKMYMQADMQMISVQLTWKFLKARDWRTETFY